jgi:hypothetical protein
MITVRRKSFQQDPGRQVGRVPPLDSRRSISWIDELLATPEDVAELVDVDGVLLTRKRVQFEAPLDIRDRFLDAATPRGANHNSLFDRAACLSV